MSGSTSYPSTRRSLKGRGEIYGTWYFGPEVPRHLIGYDDLLVSNINLIPKKNKGLLSFPDVSTLEVFNRNSPPFTLHCIVLISFTTLFYFRILQITKIGIYNSEVTWSKLKGPRVSLDLSPRYSKPRCKIAVVKGIKSGTPSTSTLTQSTCPFLPII